MISEKRIKQVLSYIVGLSLIGSVSAVGISLNNSTREVTMSESASSEAISSVSSAAAFQEMEQSQVVSETSKSSMVIVHSDPAPEIDPTAPLKYPVINPYTGEIVLVGDPNYEEYKRILGGKAGTVPFNESAECMEAWNRAQASKAAAAQSSSAASSEASSQAS